MKPTEPSPGRDEDRGLERLVLSMFEICIRKTQLEDLRRALSRRPPP